MSIKIQCPNCGEPDTVPDSSLEKAARCNVCGGTFAIMHAVVDASDYKPPLKPVEQAEADEDAMPKSEKLLLGIGLGIPALVLIFFLVFWFGIRDTWELDNRREITALSESVVQEAEKSNDDAALDAYDELVLLIGDRSIEDETLASKVESAKTAIAPVNERIEQARLAREQRLAEERAREAQANTQSSPLSEEENQKENERIFKEIDETHERINDAKRAIEARQKELDEEIRRNREELFDSIDTAIEKALEKNQREIDETQRLIDELEQRKRMREILDGADAD